MITQLSFFCGHQWNGHVCILLPHEYGSHDDGQLSWTVGMRWPNWRKRSPQIANSDHEQSVNRK